MQYKSGKGHLVSVKNSSSKLLPALSNLNPINDTSHPEFHKVKTGQNRSRSLSQVVDSPECWWDGKLTDTKVAISDCDRCLSGSAGKLDFEAPGVQSSSFFLRDRVWSVYYMSLHVQIYIDQAQLLAHPSLNRGVAQRRTDQCTFKSVGQPALCCSCVSGDTLT